MDVIINIKATTKACPYKINIFTLASLSNHRKILGNLKLIYLKIRPKLTKSI